MIEETPAFFVGEHLKKILSSSSYKCCEIVLKDLDVEGMSISDCEKNIELYARNHKKGNLGFVSPQIAEEIIREFYGIDEVTGDTFVDLSDFI